jgi:hypothetical protein
MWKLNYEKSIFIWLFSCLSLKWSRGVNTGTVLVFWNNTKLNTKKIIHMYTHMLICMIYIKQTQVFKGYIIWRNWYQKNRTCWLLSYNSWGTKRIIINNYNPLKKQYKIKYRKIPQIYILIFMIYIKQTQALKDSIIWIKRVGSYQPRNKRALHHGTLFLETKHMHARVSAGMQCAVRGWPACPAGRRSRARRSWGRRAVMWRRFLEIVSMSGDRGRGPETVTSDMSDADVAGRGRWVFLCADGFPCVREMAGAEEYHTRNLDHQIWVRRE